MHYFSGFVSAWGAAFEDFTEKAVGSAMPVFLAQRMLIGIVIGTVVLPDPDVGQRHTVALVALFFALFCWLAWARPFLVPLANVFEAAVALSQCAAVALNLWLTAAGEAAPNTVLGVTLTPSEAAGHMNTLMVVAMGAVVLRFAAVYLPTFWPVESNRRTHYSTLNTMHFTAFYK